MYVTGIAERENYKSDEEIFSWGVCMQLFFNRLISPNSPLPLLQAVQILLFIPLNKSLPPKSITLDVYISK